MALACRVNNGVVEAPNGKPSKLYEALVDRLEVFDSFKGKAMEFYALTETQEYRDALIGKKDSNGEMTLANFLKFSMRSEDPQSYIFEAVDLQHSVEASKIPGLDKVFVGGIFLPSYEALESTGVFTPAEVHSIMASEDKKITLKEFIENFEGTENIEKVDTFRKGTEEYNAIGIERLEDPEVVKEIVMEELYQATNETDVKRFINTVPVNSVIEKFKKDEQFREELTDEAIFARKVPIVRDDNATLDTLMNTLDVSKLDEVEAAATRVLSITDESLAIEEFENLVDSLVVSGVELEVDTYDILVKSTETLKSFAQAVEDLSRDINIETAGALAIAIDEFVERPTEKLINTINKGNVAALRYLDTKQSEVDLLENKNLIKIADNIYKEVNTSYSLPQLYEALLYNLEFRGNEINGLPIETMADLESYVKSKTDTLPGVNMETKEKIVLFKTFYYKPVEYPKVDTTYTTEDVSNYIMEEFAADFNTIRLEEKKKDSEIYKYFYKFFRVDHKGIRPVNNGRFAESYIKAGLIKIDPDVSQNLKDYAIVSKHFGLKLSDPISDIAVEERMMIQQNPHLAPAIKTAYQIAGEGEIYTTNGDLQFLRVGDSAFEKVLEYNNIALYKTLPKGDDMFRPVNPDKPFTNKTVDYLAVNYTSQKSETIIPSLVSKEQMQEINQEFFQCS